MMNLCDGKNRKIDGSILCRKSMSKQINSHFASPIVNLASEDLLISSCSL